MEKLLPLEKTRLLSVPMSDPDRGRKALPSAGPHVLSMVIRWSAASRWGGKGLVWCEAATFAGVCRIFPSHLELCYDV